MKFVGCLFIWILFFSLINAQSPDFEIQLLFGKEHLELDSVYSYETAVFVKLPNTSLEPMPTLRPLTTTGIQLIFM